MRFRSNKWFGQGRSHNYRTQTNPGAARERQGYKKQATT